jgi:hypothetical protein
VNLAAIRELALELLAGARAVQREDEHPGGRIVVSGMLAEQLARELSADADAGLVVFGDQPAVESAAVVVRVIAGDPKHEDDVLVRAADAAGVPVVFVQLWPQENWSAVFVLSPFVVECKPGAGFPIAEIAAQIVRAVEHPAALAARVPVLRETVESDAVRRSVARTALLAASGARKGPARPLITLEQLRMLSTLRVAERPAAAPSLPPQALAAATLAASFALRSLARAGSRSLPAPLVNVVVAAGGTWALAEALRRLEARGN